MQNLRDIFYYELVTIEGLDIVLAPINFILVALVILSTIIGIRLFKRYIFQAAAKMAQLKSKKRKDTLFRLSKQLLYALSLVLIVQSFSVNNDHIDFSTFLNFSLTGELGSFEVKVYNVLLAIFLFFVTKVGLNLFKLYLNQILNKRGAVDEGKEYTIVQLVKYLVYTIVVLIILRSTGITTDSLVFFLSAFSVALGLGLQQIFASYVSGFILFFDGSVQVGDVIEFEGEPVKVTHITIRTTKVLTVDKSVLVIPNAELTHKAVESRGNRKELTRFSIRVVVEYGTDLELVRDILVVTAEEHNLVILKRRPEVWHRDFGADGHVLDLFFWSEEPFTIEKIKSDIRFVVEKRFREKDINIPFPQRTVHITNGEKL